MAVRKLVLLCFIVIFFFFFNEANHVESLTADFYSTLCPTLVSIVSLTTSGVIYNTPSLAPALLRMHFHDCFVRGCDGSVLLNSTTNSTAERDAIPNLSLRGFELIDSVKAAVEEVCPGKVSCADILALVARDAISQINGPFWPVLLGRRDGTVSLASEAFANLPPPFFNITQLISSFESKGLNVKDLVVLSGAHTIGVSFCSSFATRIHNFTGNNDADPSMDPAYVTALKLACPPTDATTTVAMDPGSSEDFDVGYYSAVKRNKGLFQTDAALLDDDATSLYVNQHSNTLGSLGFFLDFAASMAKMGQIGVLTGDEGQLRKVCSVVN